MSQIDNFLGGQASPSSGGESQISAFLGKPKRTIAQSLGDSAIALGSGVVQGAKMLTDVAGADNAASRGLGSAVDALGGMESDYRKAQKQERAAKIKTAEASGSTWEEVKAHVGAFADAPVDTTLNALGTSAPTLAAAALSGGGSLAAQAAARAAPVVIGAAQGAGNIKGQIHETVKAKHLEAGATEAQATAKADAAQAYSGDNLGSIALGAGLGALAGGTGAEAALRRLAGKTVAEGAAPGVVRSTLAGALKEAPMEAAQGGQERLSSNVALQGEGFDVPTWQGVAGQAALEGVASAPMGGGFGAMEGARANALRQEMERAKRTAESAATDAQAKTDAEAEANKPLMLGSSTPDRLYVFPDGTVGRTGEVESYLAGLPQEEQAQARAKLMGQSFTEVNDPARQQERRWWESYRDGEPAALPDHVAEVQQAVRSGTQFSTQQTVDTVRNAMEDAWLAQNVGVTQQAPSAAAAADATGERLQQAFGESSQEAELAAVDARVRTGRILAGLQNAMDDGSANTAQVLGRLNEALARINEAPLAQEETQRVVRMLGARAAFTGQTTPAPLPGTQARPVDQFADNAAMESLIPQRASQRMGIDPAAGPLSKAAAVAVDSAAAMAPTAPTMPGQGQAGNPRGQGALSQATAYTTPNTGEIDGVEAYQAQQTAAQPAQAGEAQSAGAGYPDGGGEGRNAGLRQAVGQFAQPGTAEQGLTHGATTTANYGAQATPAAGPQGSAPAQASQQAVEQRPANWRTSMLGAVPVAKAMGLEHKGKRLAQVVAEIDARDAQAGAPAAPAQRQRSAGDHARSRSYEANPFMAFLGKHGVRLDTRAEFAPGLAEMRKAMVPGYGPVFRQRGKKLDALAQAAVEEGFLPEADERALFDLVDRSVRQGQRVAPFFTADAAESQMRAMVERQAQFEREAQEDLDAEIAAEQAQHDTVMAREIASISDAEYAQLDAAVPSLGEPSNISLEDAMRALGFTEQEIQDDLSTTKRPTAQEGGRTAAEAGSHVARAPSARDGAGQAAAGAGQEGLNSYTPGEVVERQEAQAKADAEQAKAQRDAAQREKAEREQREIAARQEGSAENYQLSGKEKLWERAQTNRVEDTPSAISGQSKSSVAPKAEDAKDDVRFSFAGQTARSANLAELQRAKDMADRGVMSARIQAETGWHRGVDGRWRFEISDDRAAFRHSVMDAKAREEVEREVRADATVDDDGELFRAVVGDGTDSVMTGYGSSREEALQRLTHRVARSRFGAAFDIDKVRDGQHAPVSDVLVHPQLLDAYPFLRSLSVYFRTTGDMAEHGSYDQRNQAITLNATRKPEEMLSTLLHELQHAIQGREDFARGGSMDAQFAKGVKDVLRQMAENEARQVELWKLRHPELMANAEKTAATLRDALKYESMERLLAYSERDQPSGVFRLIRNEMQWIYAEDYRGNKQALELQRSFYGIPRSGPKRNAHIRNMAFEAQKLLRETIAPENLQAFKADERTTKGMIGALRRHADKARAALQPLRDQDGRARVAESLERESQFKGPYEIYRALAGEVEARTTQARQHLTDEQRRNRPVAMDMDVSPAEAIVVVGGNEMMLPTAMSLDASGPATQDPHTARLDRIAQGIAAKWSNAPEVVVLSSMQDPKAPEAAREADAAQKSQGAEGEPEGFWYKGKVYLVASALSSPSDVARVVYHEALGHAGLRGKFGRALDTILDDVARLRRLDVARKAREYGLDMNNPAHVREAAEEVLAELAQTRPELGLVKRALLAIRSFLRQHVPGFKDMRLTDAEMISSYLLPARGFIERGEGSSKAEVAFSRSAMKSVEANIARGRAAMNKAIVEKADQNRAMHHAGFGWVDFAWGDGKRGIEHIIKRRMESDGMTRAEVERMLTERVVDTIASGTEVRRAESGLSTRLVLQHDGNEAVLVRRKGANGWLLTSFEKMPGASVGGATQSLATLPGSTRSRAEKGAGTEGIVVDKREDGNPRFSRGTSPSMNDYTSAQASAAEHAFGAQVKQTLAERANAMRHNIGTRLRQGLVDQFAPIKEVSDKAYMLARLSKGTDGAVEAALLYGKVFLRDGVYDVDIKDGGFAKVLAGLQGEHDRFFQWVAAQRAERLKAEGKENLLTDKDIGALKSLNQGSMADGAARPQAYMKALQQLNAFNEAALKVSLESGLIDQAAFELMRDQPYVPFYRIMEEEGGMRGPRFSSGLVNQQAWKKLKGGSQQINADLLQNTLMNWGHLYAAAARNRASLETMAAAERLGIAYQVGADAKDSVKVMRDGVAEHWAVEDPYLLDAISAMSYTPGSIVKAMAPFKRLLTFGVTVNPTFKIRNLIRDSLSAIAQSDLGYNPLANVAKGWKATAADSQTYASMLASGGIIKFGTQEDTNRLRSQIEKLGGQMVDKSGFDKLKGQMKALWGVYEEFGDRTENVNRTALYERLIAKGHSHAEASFMARDLMDFSMSGKWETVRFLAQTVPFLNARLQGLYKLGRAAKEDPRRFAIMAGAVSMASLGLLAAYSDDDDWKKREDWDRDNFWWFKIGDKAFRIPKPFEVGAIGTVAERTAELMLSEEMTGKRFGQRISDMVFNTFAMDPTPQAIKPFLDVYANKDSFSGRAIEGMADERLRPQDRFNERTSEVARLLGSWGLPDPVRLAKGEYSGLSPKQIDFLLRGYFGWLATVSTTAADTMVRPMLDRGERPAMRLRDAFLAGNFVESLPTGSSRYVSAMYEQSREVGQVWASYQAAIKSGDVELAKSIREEDGDKLRAHQALSNAKRQMADLGQRSKQISSSRDLSAEEKRERLEVMEQRRHEIAQRAMATR